MYVMEVLQPSNVPAYIGVTLRSLLETHDLSNPDIVKHSLEKEDKNDCGIKEFDVTAAFLGPTLWEKTLSDFKLEYMDLDEFLNDQGTNNEGKSKINQHNVGNSPAVDQPPQYITNVSSPLSSQSSRDPNHDGSVTEEDLCDQSSSDIKQDVSSSSSSTKVVPVNFKVAPGDLALATGPGHQDFDPCNHTFAEDELRPQAMIKKSRKQFVPDLMKDDKYWARRNKNNQAAKRSREARRVKENQIVLRASYLEKENTVLKEEVNRLKDDNEKLWQRLQKYECDEQYC